MAGARIKIPAELFALAESSRFEGELELETLSIGPDDYCFAEPVSWVVDVTNTGAALLVAGKATGEGTCACARCLEGVSFGFEGAIEGYFLIGGASSDDFEEGNDGLGDDEFDALPDDHIVDLEPLVRAALMVDVPQQPLCRDDCAGLCPSCGANLNEGACGCGRDAALEEFDREANPFSVLADYRFEK